MSKARKLNFRISTLQWPLPQALLSGATLLIILARDPGMHRTSLAWNIDNPETNVADGWDQGQPLHHDKRSKVRAACSMNTTISDMSKFTAALVRGDGLSAASHAEMTKQSLHIATANLFPLFLPNLPVSEQRRDLAASLGVIVFDGPQGHGFYKGGHDGQTANTFVCIDAGQRCVVILSNDVRSEAGFADLVRFISATRPCLTTGNMETMPGVVRRR